MRRPDWKRLSVRWPPPDEDLDPNTPDVAVLELVDGRRTLLLAPTGPDMAPEWVPFSFRHAHPELGDGRVDASDAGYMLVVHAVAEPHEREDFRRWLDEEHAPRQTALVGVNWYVGFEQQGVQHSFLNLWGINDPAIVSGDVWSAVRESPWWDRVAHIPAAGDRGVYRLIRPPPDTGATGTGD